MLGNAREPRRYSHDAGPDLEAERQHCTREGVVQAIGGELSQAHLGAQRRPQPGLKERRWLCREKGCDGTAGRVQRDGYTIAGEGGDDRGLIANAVEPIFRCGSDESVRNVRDGDWFVEQWNCSSQSHGKVRAILLHLGKKKFPAISRPC